MRRLLAVVMTAAIVVSCGGSTNSPSPTTPGGGGTSAAPSGSTAPAGFDLNSVTGTAILSGWRSSPEEGEALTQALLGFPAKYPKVQVDYQPIAGDYRTVMITKISSGEVPDLFYVNAEYAPEWIREGFLEPLDDLIAKAGIDVGKFFPGYLAPFKGTDGKIYGLPKDGNTIAMAYNADIVTAAPKTTEELLSAVQALKGQSGLKAPLCLNSGLDRGLALIYAQGGSLLTDDGTASAIDSAASKAAVQWYLDLFKNGLGMTAADMGSGWCGEALGKKQAAIAFEGGWLDPYMTGTFPDTKYAWAEMPTGSSGKPVTISYTVSYSIGKDSKNKDQALVLLSYLAGPDGMEKWTQGGVALPSRSDVPTPAGKDILTKGADYARPGSGFMPGYVDVQKAFGDAFTAQIQGKTFDAGPVVAATKAAIEKALKE